MDHARYISIEVLQNLIHLFQSLLYLEVNLHAFGVEGLYLLYSILRLRLLRIGAAVPNLERVVLPLIIRPKGGGYYTRAALIRVRDLLQWIRYLHKK